MAWRAAPVVSAGAVWAGLAIVATASAPVGMGAALSISESTVSVVEDGPGVADSFRFQQGETVFYRAKVVGYGRRKDDNDRESMTVNWKVEVFDSAGVALAPAKADKVDVDLAPQDKEWVPKIRHDFALPPLLDPGTYKIVMTVQDEVAGTTATRETTFGVRGRTVESSDVLVAAGFRFLRTEQDGKALAPPVYRAGDPVWARFDITGYKFGEGNQYEVSYGLEVFDATGKSIYQEPEAAREADQSFYRKRYVPGVLNLRPSADIAKGEYTIALRVKDAIGGVEQESRHTFRIE
ncbi:MAG: hypothetical protein R2762_23970 [Bryobacteraceae bacterium]